MARATVCMHEIGALVGQLVDAADSLQQEVTTELAWWAGSEVADPAAGPVTTAPPSPAGEQGAQNVARRAALEASLHALRLAANEAPDVAQVDEARRLCAEADALGSRVHLAHAYLELAYVLLALGRADEVPAATAAALRTLSPVQTATLSAFAGSSERTLYLSAIAYDARAAGARRDFAAVLATHGSSVLAGNAADDPFDCGIALADGLLDGWQFGALDLPAELVVLAACHSGQRAIGGRGLARLPGDDLFGLQAAFFEAGAGSVLGALWPVDDASARAILVGMHRAYAGGAEPDVALQLALGAHLADPARHHPRYEWAPLFVTSLGNPRRTGVRS